MLHIVYGDPSKTKFLDICLDKFAKNDALLLMGDAVQAVSMQEYQERLAALNHLYLNRVSVEALGLTQWIGDDVGCDEIVELIKKYGSPLTWK